MNEILLMNKFNEDISFFRFHWIEILNYLGKVWTIMNVDLIIPNKARGKNDEHPLIENWWSTAKTHYWPACTQSLKIKVYPVYLMLQCKTPSNIVKITSTLHDSQLKWLQHYTIHGQNDFSIILVQSTVEIFSA